MASPTTSLPEIPGGTANWDYRYAWVRDSSFVLGALQQAMCADEAKRYFGWLAGAALDGDPDRDTQVLFGCDGERLLHEVELDHLEGFGGARPVRIGNGAFAQRQLDVYGHILEAGKSYVDVDDYDERLQRFLCQSASRAAHRWHLPDSGIWEVRSEQQHYSSSKLMCWVALDRACELAGRLGPEADPATWRRERNAIARVLNAEAWDPRRARFGSIV